MKLSITSTTPCAVLVCSESTYTAGTDKTRFLLTGNHHIISLLPIGTWEHITGIELNTLSHERQLLLGEGEGTCSVLDWGTDLFEIVYSKPDTECEAEATKLLSSIELPGGRRVEAFNDDGLRLNEYRGAEIRSYLLTPEKGWSAGEMSLLDVGRERLLIVKTKNKNGEMLNILTLRLECLGKISGGHCGVLNGYFYRIDELHTVMGHQRRIMLLYDDGRVNRVSEEIGFFTNARKKTNSSRDIAIALVQSVKYKLKEEYPMLVANEISESVSFEDLCEFFGRFELCSVMPENLCTCEEVVVGVYDKKTEIISPKKFFFTISDGKISDVREE